jgi:hypothetical protein
MEIKPNNLYKLSEILKYKLLGKRFISLSTLKRYLKVEGILNPEYKPYGTKNITYIRGRNILNWRKKSELYES